MSKFKVNEIVIFVHTNNSFHKKFIGQECTILKEKDFLGYYEIDLREEDGDTIMCDEICLRKKKPPEITRDKNMDNKVPWDMLNDLMTEQEETA